MGPQVRLAQVDRDQHEVAAAFVDDRSVVPVALADELMPGPRVLPTVTKTMSSRELLDSTNEAKTRLGEFVAKADHYRTVLAERGLITAFAENGTPPIRPHKVLGIAGNYGDVRAHYSTELRALPLFQKASSSVIGHGGTIRINPASRYVQPEAELCVVIGTRAKDVRPEDAHRHIAGYTTGNDVTDIDVMMSGWVMRQRPDLARLGLGDGYYLNFGLAFEAKSYDTFSPIGPYVALIDAPDEKGWSVSLQINGTTVQTANTNQMIVGVPELVSALSRICTLDPGDVIFTGASGSLPALKAGDTLVHRIGPIAPLKNVVANIDAA